MKGRIVSTWVNSENGIKVKILGIPKAFNLADMNLIKARSMFNGITTLYCGKHAEDNLLNEADNLITKLENECMRLRDLRGNDLKIIDSFKLKKSEHHDAILASDRKAKELKERQKEKNIKQHEAYTLLSARNKDLEEKLLFARSIGLSDDGKITPELLRMVICKALSQDLI